jgi:hypothetical protein
MELFRGGPIQGQELSRTSTAGLPVRCGLSKLLASIYGGYAVTTLSRILTLSIVLLPFAAFAQESDQGASSADRPEMTREERRAAWESLSEEEKQAKREEMRARREKARAEWEAMTPEERDAKRAEMKAKWDAMTPEQRAAIKERRMHRRHRDGKRERRDENDKDGG